LRAGEHKVEIRTGEKLLGSFGNRLCGLRRGLQPGCGAAGVLDAGLAPGDVLELVSLVLDEGGGARDAAGVLRVDSERRLKGRLPAFQCARIADVVAHAGHDAVATVIAVD